MQKYGDGRVALIGEGDGGRVPQSSEEDKGGNRRAATRIRGAAVGIMVVEAGVRGSGQPQSGKGLERGTRPCVAAWRSLVGGGGRQGRAREGMTGRARRVYLCRLRRRAHDTHRRRGRGHGCLQSGNRRGGVDSRRVAGGGAGGVVNRRAKSGGGEWRGCVSERSGLAAAKQLNRKRSACGGRGYWKRSEVAFAVFIIPFFAPPPQVSPRWVNPRC